MKVIWLLDWFPTGNRLKVPHIYTYISGDRQSVELIGSQRSSQARKGNPQTLNPSSMPVDSGEAKDRGRTMLRRSKSMCGGTPVSIPDIFRAPEDSVMTKKRKQGGNNEDDNKRRSTSCDVEPEDGRARRNSLAEPMSTSSTIIQMRRTSGLPIFNTKSKAGEAAPQGVVFGRDP